MLTYPTLVEVRLNAVSLRALVLMFALVMSWSGAAYAQSPAPVGGDECAADTGTPGDVSKATWPCELTKRPITLAKGMAEIRSAIGINLSKALVGEPITITPALYFGVSDRLSVGLNNDTLCVSGTTGGCAKAFNSLGIDAIFAFTTGRQSIGAHGGIQFSSLDPRETVLDAGLLARLTFGKVGVILDPRIEIGLNNPTATIDKRNGLSFPVNIWYQASTKLAVGIDTGIAIPDLGHAGDFYSVPVGLDALFAVSNKVDVGGRFGLDDIAGKPKPASAADARSLTILVNFRL